MDIKNYITEGSPAKSITFIVLPLFLAAFVGAIDNTLTTNLPGAGSGITYTCTSVGVCYPSGGGYGGCALNAASCNLTSSSNLLQVLNPNSPYTYLLRGNIWGYISSALTPSSTAFGNWVATSCIAESTDTLYCTGIGGYAGTSLSTPFFAPLNITVGGDLNNTLLAVAATPCTTSGTVGVNCVPLTSAKYTFQFSGYGITYNDTAYGGPCHISTKNAGCAVVFPANGSSTSTTYPGFIGWIFSLVLVVILIVLGLGLSIPIPFSGSFSVDGQAAKLCQALAFIVFAWSIVLSEFGNWLISPAADSFGPIVFAMFGIMTGLGLFWRSQSLD